VFCGLNPIRSYATEEMDRCAKMPDVRGMKLHPADRVDLGNPAHVASLRQFVRARQFMPLTNEELRVIPGNVAPCAW
jgi:hypothetical protein